MSTPNGMHPLLGRIFDEHDPNNLGYLSAPRLGARALQDQDRYWPMPSGPFPLDQGNSPECTGYGSTHELALGPIQIGGMTAAFAHQRYLRNQQTDQAAGRNFTGGGATVQATMKAAKTDGLITGYTWNLGLHDTIAAVVNVGPVCVGTDWREGMFTPSPEGLLTPTGRSVGGHFWVLAARVKHHHTWGPGFWMVQSWGKWGVGVQQLGLTTGCAFVQDATLEKLLARTGESVTMLDYFDAPQVVEPESAPYWAEHGSRLFHEKHRGRQREIGFASYADAEAAGYRPCRVCKPRPR